MPAQIEKNPRRQAAGRQNGPMRGPLSEAARARLREATLKHQPWRFTTGPITEAGKKRSSDYGRWRQSGLISQRELKRFVAGTFGLVGNAAALRKSILQGTDATTQKAL